MLDSLMITFPAPNLLYPYPFTAVRVISVGNPHQKPNLLLYSRRITPKRAHLRVIAPRQQSCLRRCRSGGEPFAKLCKICPVRDLNSRPPAHEARNPYGHTLIRFAEVAQCKPPFCLTLFST